MELVRVRIFHSNKVVTEKHLLLVYNKVRVLFFLRKEFITYSDLKFIVKTLKALLLRRYYTVVKICQHPSNIVRVLVALSTLGMIVYGYLNYSTLLISQCILKPSSASIVHGGCRLACVWELNSPYFLSFCECTYLHSINFPYEHL